MILDLSTMVGLLGTGYVTSLEIFALTLLGSIPLGIIVALVGCYKGLNTENGAEGVGKATTGSVVTSIILIFISNYFLSLLLY